MPQILLLMLISSELGIQIARHGKPREGNHNFWIQLFEWAIIVTLLSWGGFFSPLFR